MSIGLGFRNFRLISERPRRRAYGTSSETCPNSLAQVENYFPFQPQSCSTHFRPPVCPERSRSYFGLSTAMKLQLQPSRPRSRRSWTMRSCHGGRSGPQPHMFAKKTRHIFWLGNSSLFGAAVDNFILHAFNAKEMRPGCLWRDSHFAVDVLVDGLCWASSVCCVETESPLAPTPRWVNRRRAASVRRKSFGHTADQGSCVGGGRHSWVIAVLFLDFSRLALNW